jgi:hypothetical protein
MDANIRELIVSYSRSLVSIRGSKNPCGARPQGGNLHRTVIHCHSLNASLGEIGIVAEPDERSVGDTPDIKKVSWCH